MSKEAMKQVLEQTLEMLTDNRDYIAANERAEYLAMYDKAIAGAEKALADQPAPAAQKEPLTDGQKYAMCQRYDLEAVERFWYEQGVEDAEAAHNIKENT